MGDQPALHARQSKSPILLQLPIGVLATLPFIAFLIAQDLNIAIPEAAEIAWAGLGVCFFVGGILLVLICVPIQLSMSVNEYILKPRDVTIKSGLIGRTTSVIRLADAIGVSCERNILERLTSTGSVRITFSGGHWQTFASIPNADEFALRISMAIDQNDQGSRPR